MKPHFSLNKKGKNPVSLMSTKQGRTGGKRGDPILGRTEGRIAKSSRTRIYEVMTRLNNITERGWREE